MARRSLALASLLVACGAPIRPTAVAQRGLSIAFTGDVWGELEPCG
ncbi:MAG: hypothetical protein ACYCWW_04850 [Deltaproteobacteria bacterium]